MSTDSAIRAESLAKIYRSGGSDLVVFENLSLDVRQGERVAIIGASGAGKSTLLHLLGCLDRPSKGKIYFGQRDVSGLSESDLADFRNRTLGFVWQNPSLLPEFTALENVTMPLLIRGIRPEEAARMARTKLDEVGLSARETHRAGELSGGEQQRVAVARALLQKPDLVLADEPTGNLDTHTGEALFSLMRELNKARGTTFVIVTHNDKLSSQADRIVHMQDGQII